MASKICNKCDVLKQEADFYSASRGRRTMNTCKECWKAHVIRRRRTNPAVQEYERERAKKPHRRAKATRLVANWRKNFPDKYTALTALQNAIQRGHVKRGRACAECGSRKNVFGIHPDYSKPLEVVWRCALCHHRGRFAATPVDTRAEA
jgi:hypothetical protein